MCKLEWKEFFSPPLPFERMFKKLIFAAALAATPLFASNADAGGCGGYGYSSYRVPAAYGARVYRPAYGYNAYRPSYGYRSGYGYNGYGYGYGARRPSISIGIGTGFSPYAGRGFGYRPYGGFGPGFGFGF